MSDFNSSLPVITENNGDVVVKVADATTPSQQLAVDSSGRVVVKLDDGNGNIVTSQTSGAQRALDVGVNVSGVQVDPRAIRALTSSDTVTAVQATGTNLHVVVDSGTISATQGTSPWVVNETQVGGSSITLGQKTSANSYPVVIASDQSAIPVTISSTIAGTNINKYNTTVNLAANASANHDYAITAAKTFYGRKFWASGSGKIRMDAQTSPDGVTFTTFWTGFNSTATPNISVDLDLLAITDTGAGAKMRIIITNDDKQAFDVFSTISGTEN